MATQTETNTEPRIPLSKDRVLRAAVEVADAGGIESLTMRGLAAELGVEAMSLYYHVANKEAVLDGIVDVIVGEIEAAIAATEVPAEGTTWKSAMRHRVLTARQVLLEHPWAPAVLETRTTMSLTLMRYFDATLGIFLQGGFSLDLAHHAMHALGSRALGFNQELFVDEDDDMDAGATRAMLEQLADQIPNIVAMMQVIEHDEDSTLVGCDDQVEFEFGLDILLDGLERRRAAE